MNRAEYMNGLSVRLAQYGTYRLTVFRLFGAWMVAESGEERCNGVSGNGAKWNPLNTTLPWPDTTDYNSVGVKNYKTYEDGVQATVITLMRRDYRDLLDVIQNPLTTGPDICAAIGATPWGTSEQGMLDAWAAYQANREHYNGLLIGP